MCGCNNTKASNVKYASNPVQDTPQYVVPAPKRKLTTSCDTFGNCGRIESNNFTTSEGSTASFGRTTFTHTNFPKESFSTSLSGNFTAIGLRQLAEEFAAMADQLDGQKTNISLAGSNVVLMKRKVSKKKKAKKKAA